MLPLSHVSGEIIINTEELSKLEIMALEPYIEKFKIIAERVIKLNDILSTEWNITS